MAEGARVDFGSSGSERLSQLAVEMRFIPLEFLIRGDEAAASLINP